MVSAYIRQDAGSERRSGTLRRTPDYLRRTGVCTGEKP
jgi:hypothetical protein